MVRQPERVLRSRHTDDRFVCSCEDDVRSACSGLPFYGEDGSGQYCVRHYPSAGKGLDFLKAFRKKLDDQDLDFQGVWFPERLSLPNRRFDVDVSFRRATFNRELDLFGATFLRKTNFFEATFNSAAVFQHSTFEGHANFVRSVFKGEAVFHSSTFKSDTLFNVAVFESSVDFREAQFKSGVNFTHATFHDYGRFSNGPEFPSFVLDSEVSFEFARVLKTGTIFFQNVGLRPHWFINGDVGNFEFSHVDWPTLRASSELLIWAKGHLGKRIKKALFSVTDGIQQEIDSLKARNIFAAHRLLSIACRRLAVNAEESNEYEEASKFRYASMEARRREKTSWRRPLNLSWWYWGC
jgi:uncharacterized protein YjbI with pentapeptide repeats